MPFITSPNLSSKINFSMKKESIERYHSDGIYINIESPEAFDEVFFSIYDDKELKNEIYQFISLILLSQNKDRYLSKNNLNFKRIELLSNLFKNSYFIIPVRDPTQHAFSLFNQHISFLKLHKKNSFAKRYMNYLSHFEFGENHKPWFRPKIYLNYDDPNYWLEQWCLFYDKIYEKFKNNERCIFLKYENFSNKLIFDKILDKLEIKKSSQYNFKNNTKKINLEFDKSLKLKAENLYSLLKDGIS